MATHKQITVNSVSTERAKGKSDTRSLKASFPGSPIHGGEVTDEFVRNFYQTEVMDAVINDGGHTFGTFHTNYHEGNDESERAPDLSSVETGGGGLPASPYAPNPASPGAGSTNPNDQPEPPAGFAENPSDTSYGAGSSQLNVKDSSQAIAKQKLGEYISGKSSPSQ